MKQLDSKKFFGLRDTSYVLVAMSGEHLGNKGVDTFITAIPQKDWMEYLAMNKTGKDYNIHVGSQKIHVMRSLTNQTPIHLLDIITPVLDDKGEVVKGGLIYLNKIASNICYNSNKYVRAKILKDIDNYAVGYSGEYYLFK